jgi:hypothetical protein
MNRRAALFSSIGFAACAVLPPIAGAADPSEFSPAERRLFVDDHLAALPRSATLEYAFTHRGSLEKPFDDAVTIHVGPPHGATGRPVKGTFLSHTRRVDLPDLEAATGNPVILFFLEREVREMHRLTGGSENYYRKRVRMALANGAEVRAVEALIGKRRVSATEIRLAPYHDDPARSRYERFAETSYVFTLSNDVPGAVVEMRSELRAPADEAKTPQSLLVAEVLRFSRIR